MNLKIVAIIVILSLLFFFGLEKITANKNVVQSSNIDQLKILRYLPDNNNLLFYSNFDSSQLLKNINNYTVSKNEENLILIKNSILAYLGIDIGSNNLENLYNNEIIISFFENKKNSKEDILIIFKIKSGKDLNDILNLANNIDEINQIVPIYRENKLNYLKFIYQTKDNYIIASSNKKLIKESIINNNQSKTYNQYSKEIIENFKSQKNILFSKKYVNNLPFIDTTYVKDDGDIIATTFSIKNKNLILKSYLINNNKNLDITSYDNIINKKIIDDEHQISIYSDLKSAIKLINPIINEFEQSFLEELNNNFNQNILLLSSKKDWIIVFEKNNQKKINDIIKIKDFYKYSLEKNNNVYSIYSKDILEIRENMLKQIIYNDIFTSESEKLSIVSNKLIDDTKIGVISQKFFEIKNNIYDQDFNYQKVDIKGLNFYKANFFASFDDINYLLKNSIYPMNEEFLEIVKQSIPEKNPVIYIENRLKIFH